MNDPVIERVAREDPARSVPRPDDQAEATRTRVLAAIERDSMSASRRSHRGAGRRVVGLAAAVLIVVAVVAAFVGVDHHTGVPNPSVPNDRNQPAHLPPTNPVGLDRLDAVSVRGAPQALLAHGDSLWVATPTSVIRLNLHNGMTIARIPIPTDGVNAGLTFGAGSIWVAATGTAQLLRINPKNNQLVAEIPIPGRRNGRVQPLGGGVGFADGGVWVSRDSHGPRGDIVAVNPTTDRVEGQPVTVGSGPFAVVSGFGSLWVDNTSVTVGTRATPHTYPAMSRIDPRTRRVTTEPFSGIPALGLGSVWVQSNAGDDGAAIIRVDPAGREIARIAVPRVVGVAFGAARAWAISYPRSRSATTFDPIIGTAALSQIDPRTNRVIDRPTRLDLTQPVSIAVSHGQLWIADYDSSKLTHFQLTNP